MRRIAVFATLCAMGVMLALPGGASASSLNFITISPSIVNNGASATLTISMSFADVVPTTVLLFSDHPEAAQVPPSVVVPAGVQETTTKITTSATVPETPVQIMAAVDNVPRTANMIVNEPAPAGPTLSSVTLNPTSVTGGSNSTGVVSFTGAMTQGANVQLTSSNPAVATVPSETTVSANKSTSPFNIATRSVTTQTSVTITATWFGIKKSATLTVKPGAPPTADRVAIQKARCSAKTNGCLLEIEATSTNPNAILTVFNADSGNALFTMTNNGGGRYTLSQPTISPPARITVKSNFGGVAGPVTVGR
jgi:hypothetical protein